MLDEEEIGLMTRDDDELIAIIINNEGKLLIK